jgi:alginate O-acetyltransferase complex protein AlgI
LNYIFLFPIFTAGPIERFDHFERERETELRAAAIIEGLSRIVYGLIKKFVFAGMLIEPILGDPSTREILGQLDQTAPATVAIHLACLFLYSYLDFSAYSDIAIGASRLFGFPILENFNFPILAPNIVEFWNRWHMSLTGWCRAYVYLPLIGMTRNPYLATFGAFTVIGLWHEGSLNYLAWGLWHATGISVYQFTRRLVRRRNLSWFSGRWMRVPGTLATLAYVSGSYAFTATRGIEDAFRLLARLFGA